MQVDVCVATTVGAMPSPAGHGVMYIRGDYALRAAGPESLVCNIKRTSHTVQNCVNLLHVSH